MSKLLAIISTFVLILRTSLLHNLVSLDIYYGWFFLVASYTIIYNLNNKEITINYTTLVFLLVCALSIVINNIDPFFRSWERLIGFTFFIISFGPLFESNWSVNFKLQLLQYAAIAILAFTLLSFLGYLLNLGILFRHSKFYGITKYPMVLGPIAAFSTLIAYYKTIICNGKKASIIIYGIIAVISFLTCLLAGSRGALLSLLISFIFMLIITYKKNTLKAFIVLILLSTSLFITSKFWIPYAETLISKHQSRMETDNVLSGRNYMWIDRIEDFKDSPFIGVGYRSMKNTRYSKIDRVENTFEPGSSWLFVLSTLGLLGFILFAKLVFKPIMKISTNKNLSFPSSNLISSFLIFYTIHMLIEGYALSAGDFLSYFLWLSISAGQTKSIYTQRVINYNVI